MGLNNQGGDWRKRKTGYLPLAASRCLLRRASQETIDGRLYTMAPHFLALEFGGELVHCYCTPSLSFSILWWPMQRAWNRGSMPKMLQSSPWKRIANVVFRSEHNTVSPLTNVGSHPPQLAGPAETRETNLLFSPSAAQCQMSQRPWTAAWLSCDGWRVS